MSQEKSENAFDNFVRSFRSKLQVIAVATCGELYAAEDVVQEALVILHKRWDDVDPGARFAYVKTVLVRLAGHRQRTAASRFEFLSGEFPENSLSAGGEFADQIADRLTLVDALLGLPPRQQRAVYMRYWECLSIEDIARLLGVPAGTVRSDLSRGKLRLKAFLLPEQECGLRPSFS